MPVVEKVLQQIYKVLAVVLYQQCNLLSCFSPSAHNVVKYPLNFMSILLLLSLNGVYIHIESALGH